MKQVFVFLMSILFLMSCKKEGCTDSNALNFNAEAKKDDGSCTYKVGCTDPLADNYDETAHKDDGTCIYDTKGFLKLNFKAKFNGSDLIKNTNYLNVDNVTLNFSFLKTYLSTLDVVSSSGTTTNIDDVLLIDFFKSEDLSYVYPLPEGDYSQISFIAGLSSSQNMTDPSSLDSDNPLSIYSNMYWNWATHYIFYKVEGTYDSDGDPSVLESSFIYHIGSDALATSVQRSKTFSIFKKDTTELNVYLNMDQFFYNSSDTIHVLTDHTTQTVDNPTLAKRISFLYKSAFSIP